jgi:cell division protein DivIC
MLTPHQTKVSPLSNRSVEKYDRSKKIQTNRKRGLFRRLALFGILVFIGTYSIVSTLSAQTITIEEKKLEQQAQEKKLVEVTAKKEHLKLEVTKLHDIEYIGEIARKEYSFSRPGETIFKLPTND